MATDSSKQETRKACPQCGSFNVGTTTHPIILGPDTNHADCIDCGWNGRVYEMVEKSHDVIEKK